MQLETHSKTQSFKASDIADLDEMIDEWSERNQRVITSIALVLIPEKEIIVNAAIGLKTIREEQIHAIITYNIKTNLLKPDGI